MQRDLAVFAAKRNFTAQDYATLITGYPQLGKELRRGWAAGNPARQDSDVEQLAKAYAELKAGNAKAAIQLLRTGAAAMRRRGKEERAHRSTTIAEMAAIDVKSAMKVIGLTLTAIVGPAEFAAMFSALRVSKRADAPAPADVLASGSH